VEDASVSPVVGQEKRSINQAIDLVLYNFDVILKNQIEIILIVMSESISIFLIYVGKLFFSIGGDEFGDIDEEDS
jgi:hypothetical protein